MASLTYLHSIANNTPYTLTLIDGENRSQSLAIGAQQAWNARSPCPGSANRVKTTRPCA